MENLLLYIGKVCILLLLFFSTYRLLIAKETLFKASRLFLLTGIGISFLLPLISITKTVLLQTTTNVTTGSTTITAGTATNTAASINYWQIAGVIYIAGAVFFTLKLVIQLFSLKKALQTGNARKLFGIYLIPSKHPAAPFSFFNRIILNNSTTNTKDAHLILQHEYAHVRQLHSIDILLLEITNILLWFFPLTYVYKNAVKQNLEYLADQAVQQKTDNIKNYQYLLVKNISNNQQLPLINSFYHLSIKKRIVMLQKSKSNPKQIWKLSIALPFLVAFFMLFNIKTIAQQPTKSNTKTELSTIYHELVIDSNTSNETIKNEISSFKKLFNIELKVETERNSNGQIISLNSKYNNNSTLGSYSISKKGPITPIVFYAEKADDGTINCGYKKPTLSTGNAAVSARPTSVSYSSSVTSNNNTNTSPTTITIKADPNNSSNSTPFSKALFVVDGKKQPKNFDPSTLNPDLINSINVLKGDNATKKYGKEGQDGVIEIFTKK